MLIRVLPAGHINYARLAAAHAPGRETWDTFVRDVRGRVLIPKDETVRFATWKRC